MAQMGGLPAATSEDPSSVPGENYFLKIPINICVHVHGHAHTHIHGHAHKINVVIIIIVIIILQRRLKKYQPPVIFLKNKASKGVKQLFPLVFSQREEAGNL